MVMRVRVFFQQSNSFKNDRVSKDEITHKDYQAVSVTALRECYCLYYREKALLHGRLGSIF